MISTKHMNADYEPGTLKKIVAIYRKSAFCDASCHLVALLHMQFLQPPVVQDEVENCNYPRKSRINQTK